MTDQPPSLSWWDPGRFVKTLSYFGAVPFLGDLDWFQQLLGSRVNPQSNPAEPSEPGTVGLLCPIAPLAQQIAQKLTEQGYGVEQSPATLTQIPLRAIVCQPSEDLDLGSLLQQLRPQLQPASRTVFDFTRPNPDLHEVWGALDDVVMGGVSESQLDFAEGTALFTGNVSTANSGGFASVRTRNFEPPLDLAGMDGLELRVQGDGKRYKFLLRSESAWDGVAYSSSFDTAAETWTTVRLPFADMVPVFRARTVQVNPLDPSRIYAVQLMLSKFEYDGALNPHFSPGPFQLQIESIRAYSDRVLPQVILLSTGQQEEQVHQSGLPYTILRLPEVAGSPAGEGAPDSTAGETVAQMVVQSLSTPEWVNRTLS